MLLARRRKMVRVQVFRISLFSLWILALCCLAPYGAGDIERYLVGACTIGLFWAVRAAVRLDLDERDFVRSLAYAAIFLFLIAALGSSCEVVVRVHVPYPALAALRAQEGHAVLRLLGAALIAFLLSETSLPLVDRRFGPLLGRTAAKWCVRLTLLGPLAILLLASLPPPIGGWLGLHPSTWVLAVGVGLIVLGWIEPDGLPGEMAQLVSFLIGMEWMLPVGSFISNGRHAAPAWVLMGSAALCWYLLTRSRPLE